jgi:site-specific recombinase XerD
MKNALTLSQVLEGFELACQARHLSPHTIADYFYTYRKLAAYLVGDPPFCEITHELIRGFLGIQTVSNKTVLNYHIGLSALWTWAVTEHLAADNLLHRIERPKPEQPVLAIYSLADIKALLSALNKSKSYARPGKAESDHALPNPERNTAIILLMLDTGLRVSELCDLRLNRLDVRNRRITIWGKGNKERIIPFCPRTGQALWKYLAAARKEARLDEPVFATRNGRQMDRMEVLHMLAAVGSRAGVQSCHPHAFRHTFAVNYLRNGGDIYTLQEILGHSSLEMVKRYLHLAQVDIDTTHRRASPVDNWRL